MTGFPAPDRRFSLGSPMPSSGLRACARRLAGSPQPNRVHFLRTALSLPAALHLASRRRSCFQLYTFHVSVERTFTSPIKCACTRTSAGGSPASCGQPAAGLSDLSDLSRTRTGTRTHGQTQTAESKKEELRSDPIDPIDPQTR